MSVRQELVAHLEDALAEMEIAARLAMGHVNGATAETRAADGLLLRACVMRAQLYANLIESQSSGMFRVPPVAK